MRHFALPHGPRRAYLTGMDDDSPLLPIRSAEEMEAELRRAEADVVAGRVVPVEVALARMQAAIGRIHARQQDKARTRA
jgi:hypothetical protein